MFVLLRRKIMEKLPKNLYHLPGNKFYIDLTLCYFSMWDIKVSLNIKKKCQIIEALVPR